MKQISQLLISALVAIIFIPGLITLMLGNNQPIQQTQAFLVSAQKEEESLLQLVGIVAKEMPITYEEEALKAQVVMTRSYIASTKNETLSFMSLEDLKKLWANDYNRNYAKIEKAIVETRNMVLTYNNEAVQPVYHLQSAGVTQTPMDIWDLEVPYLESVQSKWDEMAPNLTQEKEYNAQEIIHKVNEEYSDTVLQPYGLETQIQIIERTQGGYVKSIQVGNLLMSGDEFRKLLDLRSSCFGIDYNNANVSIITKGAGHGVGLSQYGANEMAKEGKDFEEILTYYFPKITIQEQN